MHVRDLTSSDATRVAVLLEQLGYPCSPGEAAQRIESWGRDDRATAFGVELDGWLAGCAAVWVVPFFERRGARARLVALVVDEAARRRGVGRHLVQEAVRFSAERGAVELELTSRVSRPEAHRFYPDLGFEDVSSLSRRYLARLAPFGS